MRVLDKTEQLMIKMHCDKAIFDCEHHGLYVWFDGADSNCPTCNGQGKLYRRAND